MLRHMLLIGGGAGWCHYGQQININDITVEGGM